MRGRRLTTTMPTATSVSAVSRPGVMVSPSQMVPIKKLLLGQSVEQVLNRDAMANPECLDWYVAYAANPIARR